MTGLNEPMVPEEIVIRNDLVELRRVAGWVRAGSKRHDVPPAAAQRLDLCSTELVTNVMTHGYVDDRPHDIALRLRCGRGVVSLEIEDDGVPFNPLDVDEPETPEQLEEAKIGGLGIHLVRKFSDELRHDRSDGRNHVTLLLRVPTP